MPVPWGEMMKSLADVGNFFRSREPAISSVKLRVASALNVFVSIRGLEALLNSGTAVVMRKGYEAFVIQDTTVIDHRENVLAVVHVKDMRCYNRLTKIQTNHFLHRRTLDRTISNDLADEMAKRLLKKVTTGDAGRKVVPQV
jgi:lipopolysaccharide biosynthesis regulator YciM